VYYDGGLQFRCNTDSLLCLCCILDRVGSTVQLGVNPREVMEGSREFESGLMAVGIM
jgi:hypothetical protein